MDIREMIRVLWARKWIIMGITAFVGAATLGLGMLQKNVYRASAVVKPVEEREGGGASQIGGMLSGFGIDFGGSSDIQSLAVLFKSQELAVRVFGSDNLYLKLFPDWEKAKSGSLLAFGNSPEDTKPGGGPSDWDYIRAAQKFLAVQPEIKKKIITVSFDSNSPGLAAEIVGKFMSEAKNLLQDQALSKATKNVKFLEDLIRNTHDPMAKDKVFSLYSREIEREMLARNKDQFGFVVVDSARVPDKKIAPHRLKRAIIASFLVFLACAVYFLLFRQTDGGAG